MLTTKAPVVAVALCPTSFHHPDSLIGLGSPYEVALPAP